MADPYYANVSLLLPMNGANNGTVFTDYSPTPKTITRYNAVTSTAQSTYYGSSGYFDGSGDYLTVPGSGEFSLPGDFTIEAWIIKLPTSTPSAAEYDELIFGGITFAPDLAFFITNTTPQLAFWNGTAQVTSSIVMPYNTPVHVAACRSGTTLKLFTHGVAGYSGTMTTQFTVSGSVYLGGHWGTNNRWLKGYANDYRLTPGIARYTADFTPPARLLPGISGTILDTNGVPCARQIYVYNQATGALLASTTSGASTGYYETFVPPAAEEVFRVVVANEATLYNNLIDRVFPA